MFFLSHFTKVGITTGASIPTETREVETRCEPLKRVAYYIDISWLLPIKSLKEKEQIDKKNVEFNLIKQKKFKKVYLFTFSLKIKNLKLY